MKSDIVIVGGGIIGLYSAYLLALNGIKLTIVERGMFGQESTWAAGGILSPLLPWDYTEDILYLTDGASHTYKNLSDVLLEACDYDIEYWKCGLSVFISDIQRIERWCDLNKYLYNINTKDTSQIHFPDVVQIRTPQLIKGLVKQLKLLGVKLLTNTNVSSCDIQNNKVVGINTSKGKIITSTLIWTTGAWLSEISTNGIQIQAPNISPIKGQIITLENNSIDLKSILFKNGHYLIPRRDGLILAGSTLEDVGYDNSISENARHALWEKSLDLLPELINSRITHQWAGLRPATKNSAPPTIGPHPVIQGLFFNCGHFRYGITMAPKSCEILNNWVVNNGKDLTSHERSYSKFV